VAGGPVSTAADTGPGGVAISGGTGLQRAIVRDLLADMGSPRIASVELREAEADSSLAGVAAGTVISTRLAAGSGGLGAWHARLVNSAFADRSTELGLPCVTWGETIGGGSALGCPPDAPPPSCDAFAEGAPEELAALHRAELLVHQRIGLGPGRAAHRLELYVEDTPRFMLDEMEELLAEIRDEASGCQGTYVVVLDGDEQPAYHGWVVTGNSATTMATGGVREDLRGCWSEPSVGGPPPPPPPCPTT
jgi:hypothetical protein